MKNVLPQNQILKKIIILFIFSLVLLIPLQFIESIIDERDYLYRQTSESIGAEWGDAQLIAGPVITIPYTVQDIVKEKVTDDKGKTTTIENIVLNEYTAVILLETLNADFIIDEEIRMRGIYKTLVYTSDMKMNGVFEFDMGWLYEDKRVTIHYDEVRISLGLNDTKGLVKVNKFVLNGKEIELLSGTSSRSIDEMSKGISGFTQIGSNKTFKIEYNIDIAFRGSNSLQVIPVAKANDITMTSSWQSPSFFGLLPVERKISEQGFTANWQVSHLVRNYSQVFLAKSVTSIDEAIVGVTLFDGITHYRQVIRAVKYGYLFIALSILTLFIFEIASRKPTHYIQYGIVGASLVMFYLLLLSLSEHLPFMAAYLISTAAIVLPISLYIISIMRDKRFGAGMFIILTGLYLILFSILKMEDYALITGTALVMITLYALMYITRNLSRNSDILQTSKPEDKKEE